MQCTTTRKKKLTLITDNRKRGGEGCVYRVAGHPRLVAKVYHPANTTDKKRSKLETMLASPPKRFLASSMLAWPRDLLFNEAGQFIGFTMAAAKAGSDELCAFTHKTRRLRHHPQTTRRTFYRIAINLCRALESVHELGHVVGDFNPNNIMCRENGAVTLIDTDSFNIQKEASYLVYPCEVGMNDYIAPEIQNKNRREITWRKEHDYFALAVHLFQILLENRHPFSATPRTGVAPAEYACKLIAKGTYPHVRNAETKHDDLTDILPERIRAAFRKTFVEGFQDPSKRLTPKDWIVLLKRELKSLKQCQACPEQYEGNAPHCPYCTAVPVSLMNRCGNSFAAQARRLRSLPAKAFRALANSMPARKPKPSTPPKMRLPKGRNRFAGLYPMAMVMVFVGIPVIEIFRNHPDRSKNAEDSAQQAVHATPLNAAAVATPRQRSAPEKTAEQAFMELVARINRAAIVPNDPATIRQSPDGTRRYEYVSKDYFKHDDAVEEFNEIRERIQRFAQGSEIFREVPISDLHQHFSEGCLFRSKNSSIILVVENYSIKSRVLLIVE
jgi:DNA-binding helix-hairpin-helix protein with protein kinase domain